MAKNDLGELRRASLVSTFGPGAVVDFRAAGGAVSGVVAGLETWDEKQTNGNRKAPAEEAAGQRIQAPTYS